MTDFDPKKMENIYDTTARADMILEMCRFKEFTTRGVKYRPFPVCIHVVNGEKWELIYWDTLGREEVAEYYRKFVWRDR